MSAKIYISKKRLNYYTDIEKLYRENRDEINDRNQASKRSMTITMEGALSKWTNVMKGWQYRWFVLDDSAGIFSYYTSKDKMTRGVRRGCVRLRGALIGIDDEVGTELYFLAKTTYSNSSTFSRDFYDKFMLLMQMTEI